MTRSVTSTLLALAVLGVVGACGTNPPQIVDYSPQRGMTDVSTSTPIRITFDRDVDKASVEARLHTDPGSSGHVEWLNARSLSYVHEPFKPSTVYQAILESGYRAASGDVYELRHHWQFTTEGPPAMSGSTPAAGEHGVDPASNIALDFTRGMDQASLPGATSIVPAVPFTVRLDPSDNRHAILAPNMLLRAGSDYTVTVTTDALDADGNHLDRAQTFTFTTGAIQPLHHWVGFVGQDSAGIGSVWMVDESRFPRLLYNDAPVDSFSWSPEGQRLMVQRSDGGWSVVTIGDGATPIAIAARWAAALAPGLGYVYIDSSGTLRRLTPDGVDALVASDVTQAAVAPGGDRIVFARPAAAATDVWGYDVGLHALYRLTSEPTTALGVAAISGLAWAPSGNRLAYIDTDSSGDHLRVLTLGSTSTRTTLASGHLGPAAWFPDSTHLVVSATVATPAGTTIAKAFVISTSAPPTELTLSAGLPAQNSVDVSDPVPSPDGHQIAFVNLSGSPEIWLMNADGTDPLPMTRFDPMEFPFSSASPAWSRD